jgi:O-antigen/teichoic acid export membrane protein
MAIQESWARLRGQGFLGSVGVLVGGTGIAGAISALMLPVLTRLYTPQDFSLLAVLTGAIAIVSVAACLRFDIAIPVPEQDNEAANVLGLAVLSLAVIVALLAGALLIVPASLLARFNQPDLESYLWLVPVGVTVVALNSALQLWLIRRKDFAAIARNRVAQAGAGAATQATVGWLNGMTLGLIFGPTVGAAVGCVGLAYRVVGIENNLLRDINWPGMRAAWSHYYRFPKYSALEALSNNAGIQLPIILIAALAAGPEAGFLMLAIAVIQAPMALLGTAVGQVFLSRAPQEFRLGRLGTFTATIVGGLLKTGIGPLIFGGLLAPDLFAKVFGEEWRRAGVLMAWMTPWFVMQFLASPVSMALHVANRQRAALFLQLFGVVLRVGAVYGASLIAMGLISEAYAISGFVFYLVYLVVVFHAAGVRGSDILIEIRAAIPPLVLWIGAGLLFKAAVSFGPVARWIH